MNYLYKLRDSVLCVIPCLLIIYDNFSANLPPTNTKGTDL